MAVTDKREIEFDADAIVYCLSVSPRAAQGFGLPSKPPTRVNFNPAEGCVHVVYDSKDNSGAVRISVEALGAVLVSYCIRSKIPMPRVADKSVRIESNCIVLAFKSTFNKAPVPEVPDSTSRAAETVKSWTWTQPQQPTRGNP